MGWGESVSAISVGGGVITEAINSSSLALCKHCC
jgi:hypothetical protein